MLTRAAQPVAAVFTARAALASLQTAARQRLADLATGVRRS